LNSYRFIQLSPSLTSQEIIPWFLQWDPRYVDYKNSNGENLLSVVLIESRQVETTCLAVVDYLLEHHPSLLDGVSHEGKHCLHHVR
jgi:hypothetical protein